MSGMTDREQMIQLSTKLDSVIENQTELKAEMREGMKELNNKFDTLSDDVNKKIDDQDEKTENDSSLERNSILSKD